MLIVVYGRESCDFCHETLATLSWIADGLGEEVHWKDAERHVYGRDEKGEMLAADELEREGIVDRFSALIDKCNSDLPLVEIDGKYYSSDGAEALLEKKCQEAVDE